MLLFVPYNTDAPIYHFPYATIGLIVVNALVYCLQLAIPAFDEGFRLQFGTLNPLQWVTCFFMHAGIFHLIGNMIFLWIFGLIVEGKVGWKLFLVLYMSIGLVSSFILQLLMITSPEGAALGASAAIYGLMAVAMIWAPVNEISFKVFGLIFFYVIASGFEVSVSNLVFFYLAGDFFWAYMSGFSMSSQFAHLTGAAIGGFVGYQFLNRRLVNCEGYDLMSMWRGKLGEKPEPTIAEEQKAKRLRDERKIEFQNEVAKFREYVNSSHIEMAFVKLTHLKRQNSRFKIDKETGWKLVQGLIDKQKTESAAELVEELISKYPESRSTLILNLALIHVQKMDRPRKAIDTLGRLKTNQLNEKQAALRAKIKRLAFKKIEDGQLEIGD